MRPEGKKIPPPKLLITTNLDNDDAFSSDVVELLQRELRPAPGKRIYSLLYGYQYFTDRRFALKMRYTNNHFLTLAEPFDAHTETIIPTAIPRPSAIADHLSLHRPGQMARNRARG